VGTGADAGRGVGGGAPRTRCLPAGGIDISNTGTMDVIVKSGANP
jgi:hypothetical protein